MQLLQAVLCFSPLPKYVLAKVYRRGEKKKKKKIIKKSTPHPLCKYFGKVKCISFYLFRAAHGIKLYLPGHIHYLNV